MNDLEIMITYLYSSIFIGILIEIFFSMQIIKYILIFFVLFIFNFAKAEEFFIIYGDTNYMTCELKAGKNICDLNDSLENGVWHIYRSVDSLHIMETISLKDSARNGLYKSFSISSDSVEYEGNYVNGLKEGEWTMYYETGTPKYVQRFEVNKLVQEDYFRNDYHFERRLFLGENKKTVIKLYRTGVVKREEHYQYMGNKILSIGVWKYYNSNGELTSEETYKEGVKVKTKTY